MTDTGAVYLGYTIMNPSKPGHLSRQWLKKHGPSTSGQNAVTYFQRLHSRVSAMGGIRYVAPGLSQGPNIDHPTEGPSCYCVRSVGNVRTSTLGAALEWKWCAFVRECHHYGYVASSELRLPRAVVGTTHCHLGQ